MLRSILNDNLIQMSTLFYHTHFNTILDYREFCGPFGEGILIGTIKAFSCAPWVSWGFVMATAHSIWVTTLLVCNVYQVSDAHTFMLRGE